MFLPHSFSLCPSKFQSTILESLWISGELAESWLSGVKGELCCWCLVPRYRTCGRGHSKGTGGLGAHRNARAARRVGGKPRLCFFPTLPSHSGAQGSLLVVRFACQISCRFLPSEYRRWRSSGLILALCRLFQGWPILLEEFGGSHCSKPLSNDFAPRLLKTSLSALHKHKSPPRSSFCLVPRLPSLLPLHPSVPFS